jgi:GMP synthase (glutamine-hydrolysing)
MSSFLVCLLLVSYVPMPVLICKNISTEGPGTIEDYLSFERIPYTIVDLAMRESIPDMASYDARVMLGDPMSVNDDLQYIRREEDLVRDFAANPEKMLCICLGAQIMAKALGARIYKGPAPESGWYDITLREEGLNDHLMRRLAAHPETGDAGMMFAVFHWHGETFDIPAGAARLVSSELYPNQACRHGEAAYAFQFHIEVNEQIIYDWMAGENIDRYKLKVETGRYDDVYRKRAFVFYEHLFRQSTN